MPIAKLEIPSGVPQDRFDTIVDSVIDACSAELGVGREVVTTSFRQVHREGPLLVEITLFPGRSAEAKAKLYQSINDSCATLENRIGATMVVLYEVPKANWGIDGTGSDRLFPDA